jgi:hypothetical protein
MYRRIACFLSLLLGALSSRGLCQSNSAPLSYLKLPLVFEANQGQSDAPVRFLSRGTGYSLYLTPEGAVLQLAGDSQLLHMRLVGANPGTHAQGREMLPGKSNYFLGNDPARWVTNVPQYGAVSYAEVYPGVDLVYHGDHQSGGRLEYDFVVAPGADPNQIELDFSSTGAKSGTITVDSGDLLLSMGRSQIRNLRPVVYQYVNGRKREVPGRYLVSGGHRVRFALGEYDHSQTLIIDPVILYTTATPTASLLGNTAVTEPCQPCLATAVDSSGNVYVAGSTTDTNFPTQNPFQANPGGQKDVFISKINAAGTALIFSTYLGGGGSDVAYGLAVDSNNNVYITGYTNSGGSNNTTNFPLQSPLQASLGGFVNAFVTKLSSSGSALVYSTYLGGNYIDIANGIAVDSTGAAYVVGYTYSKNFPTASPLQAANLSTDGSTNAFLTKINPAGTALVYSTYLGGTVSDAAYAVTVDANFNAYVTGGSSSPNFPTANALQSSNANSAGGDNAFIAEMNAAGSALLFSTYYGGTGTDDGYAIALDSNKNLYVTGYTNSLSTFPTFNPLPPPSGAQGGFLVKLNAGGGTLAYATTIDSNGKGVAVDSYGNAYLTGRGIDTGGNAVSMALRVNAAGNSLDYDFQLGEALTDVAQAIAVDSSGNVYVAGTGAIDTTTTPPQSANNSATTVSVAKVGQAAGGPYIGVLQPSTAISGASSATVHVLGTGFVSGAQVLVNGSARTTTFVGATEVDGVLTASDLAVSGALSVTVANPTGGPSNAVTFTVTNAPPAISSFSPPSITAGGSTFTLTVNGSGFTTGSVVYWNSLARNTTLVSSSQVTAQILSGDIAAGGLAAVQVYAPAPGGGLSAAASYPVNNPVPALGSISPNTATAGGSTFTLTAQGSGFTGASLILWNGSSRTTTFVSTTELQAAILASDLLTSGLQTVTVQTPTPGGGASTGLTFTVTGNSVPQIVSLSPSSVIAGGAGFTLAVNGSGFVGTSQVLWNGNARTTTFVTSSQLTISVTSSDIASIGTASVAVSSPSPGGGTSGTLTFNINGNPVPTTSGISPTSATAGGPGFTLTVTGTGFVTGASVYWNGASRLSNIVSSTRITTQITAQDIASGATPSVQVFVPTPGGGLSSPALSFTINNPVPAITSISPNTLPLGGGNFTLTVNGSGFTPSSQVQWNGSARSTTFSSSSLLTASITSTDLGTPGTATVTVFNPTPAGGTSGGSGFTVAANPTPAITNISPSVLGAGSSDFTLTVTGSGFLSSSTVQWNGSNRTTTYISATTLNAAITSADISGVGTATVQVSTPPPGGGLSNSEVFTISAGCTYSLTPSATNVPATASTGSVAVNAPPGCAWSASSGNSFLSVTAGANGSGVGTVSFSVAANTGSGRTGTLTIASQQVSITQATAIEGAITPTAASGAANGIVHIPVNVTLNGGVSVDGLSFTLQITPNSPAPSLGGSLGFSADGMLPTPGTVDTSGGAGTISVTWTGLSPAVSGTVYLGDVLVTMPSTVQAGQTYGAQISAASGSFQSNSVPISSGASATLTVVLDYLVGDPFPFTGDNVGQFGDNTINTLDLITTLRVATAVPGYVPPTGCDRFDAMDASPVDTATTRGGNGSIDTLDMIVILQRATNIDTTRPRRISRGLSCPTEPLPAVVAPSTARLENPLEAEASLELLPTADGGTDVYLQAFRDLHLAGLALSLGSANSAATLTWTSAAGVSPSLLDASLASIVAAAWLTNLDLAAHDRMLLGHVTSDVAAPLVIHGGTANLRGSGDEVKLLIGGVLRIR